MRLKYKKIILLLTMGIMGIGMVVTPIDLPDSQTADFKRSSAIDVINHSPTAGGASEITITKAPTPTFTPTPIPVDPLEMKLNAFPEINELIHNYYTAKLNRDEDTLKQSVTDPSVIDINVIHRKVEYINDYHNINCYTKPGVNEGEYIVYVTYDMEIVNIETYAPSVDEFYITYVDGSPKLLMGQVSEEITNLKAQYRKAEDVIALTDSVDACLVTAVKSDEQLYQFFVNLTGQAEATPEPTKTE